MTWIQLTQFGLMLFYLGMVTAFNCKKFHKFLTYFFFINVAFMMYLFADFYRKAYKKNKIDNTNCNNLKSYNNKDNDINTTQSNGIKKIQ